MSHRAPHSVQVQALGSGGRGARPALLKEFVGFLTESRKWWLAPVLAPILLLGGLLLVQRAFTTLLSVMMDGVAKRIPLSGAAVRSGSRSRIAGHDALVPTVPREASEAARAA